MTPEEIEKIQEKNMWDKYTRAIQRLLDDGMPLEELMGRMARYIHLKMNEQANIMDTMLKMRRGGA